MPGPDSLHHLRANARLVLLQIDSMPPKRKTGVQNVDIGGAYKLDRQDPDSEHNAVQV